MSDNESKIKMLVSIIEEEFDKLTEIFQMCDEQNDVIQSLRKEIFDTNTPKDTQSKISLGSSLLKEEDIRKNINSEMASKSDYLSSLLKVLKSYSTL